jgi:hypothetical protein
VKKETKCLICDASKKSFNGCDLSNLKRHLIRKHKETATEHQVKFKTKRNLNGDDEESSAKKRDTKESFIRQCVGVIVFDLIPFCKFKAGTFFRRLFASDERKYGVVMSVEKIKEFLFKTRDSVTESLKNEMKNKLISLKFDVGFFGLNAQFYSQQEKKIVIRNLGN